MQECAGEKRWEDIDGVIGRLRERSQTLTSVEENRCSSFDAVKIKLGVARDAGFLSLLPLVPEQARDELLCAYRELKVAVYSVKGATTRLTYFFKSVEESFRKVLGELFPHRKGRLYAKDGKPTKIPVDALLLNKHL